MLCLFMDADASSDRRRGHGRIISVDPGRAPRLLNQNAARIFQDATTTARTARSCACTVVGPIFVISKLFLKLGIRW